MIIQYKLEQFKESDKDFFCDMISYISPFIQKSVRSSDAVDIYCCEQNESDVRESIKKLEDMITGGRFSDKDVSIKTIDDHTDNVPMNNEPIFQDMKDKGYVKEICSGVFAYSSLFLAVMRYFDRKIDEFGKAEFKKVTEYTFPVLYPVKDYEKGKYFETFPHHIMFQTKMKNDISILERFAKNGIHDETILEEMAVPKNVLRHAACVPVYSILENQTIYNGNEACFLISGKCFRNEADNVFELARLNEFYMKEYVFAGSPEYCNDSIENAKNLWRYWTDVFGLRCKTDTANDSFFASNYKKLKLFQILGDSKQEFKIQLPSSDTYVACSSANHHRTHFSKPYNIKGEDGAYCYTACFAFGVERLSYTLLSQKGLDVSKWDKATVDEMKKYVNLDEFIQEA